MRYSILPMLNLFNNSEFCEGESSTQSRPAYDKFNKMSFVKADMIYNCLESVKYDNQNSPKLNENGKAGIGFSKPESSKPDWLKNRLDKDKAKASQKPFVHNQSWPNSKKVKSGWKKFQQRRDQHDHYIKPKLKRTARTLTLYHSSEMASSLLSRSHHIDFDSVFCIDDAGIVQMFESLVSTGLMEFLGCPAIFYEQALIEFFENGSVRDGMVVSTINGTAIEISESVFAAAFGLPTEGLTDLSEVPRDHLSNAQKLFSASEKESLFVKAGSFDAVTRDRFLLMTAITFDVKINWGNLLFGVLKEMVTPDSRQAKGYAIQICVLLKNIPGLELGESKAFPVPRILNEKTVHRIVSVNENVGEVGDAPRAKPTPVKRTVSKKRQASVNTDVAPIIKKKRTTKIKPVAAKKLVLEETIAAIPSTEELLPVQEITFEDADATIRQVLSQLDMVCEPQDDAHRGRDETWFDRAFDEAFVAENQEDQASISL
ncbi:hypothetical protein F511_19866 [Dorcoceras hygrometricum]|uniref:Dystroglycan-like n=1 Tax=Dorcoceras hygrometricum TaxID=472368 RepID=A0A2Z7C6V9_9LAMI|nr:hypothetical protein F511_19866 [Dorcoceras hygrometricum]